MCREFILFGMSLFAYKQISFDKIKVKAFAFMFCVWSFVIIIYNNIYVNGNSATIMYSLYCLYLWWLVRIYLIKPEVNKSIIKTFIEINKFHKYKTPYNVLIPVNSFRGMLQILFLPHKNPLYETRLLVDHKNTIGVVDNKFVEIEYSQAHIKSIVRKKGRIKPCKNYSKGKIDKLVGKSVIFGIRDCRRLEL